MKVSREQAADNRARVLEVAGKLFRENGFDGISVAEIMSGAGLTHGGFYNQFGSKDDLAAEACALVLAEAAGRWRKLGEGDDPLGALVSSYLSPRHRDVPSKGCAVPSLAAEAVRQPAPVRAAFTKGLRDFIDILAGFVTGRTAETRRRKALTTMAGMVGTMVLARAVNDAALSAEILAAGAKTFGTVTA
jgi:TetR/AcrR family transcriptional regulator, transcriptional repressor for nem operon